MNALTPGPLETALLMITFVALLLAVGFGLAAVLQLFNVRDPEEATAIARRIGKPEDEVEAAAAAATLRGVKLRHRVLIAAAFGAVAGLTDFILPAMLDYA